MKRTTKSEGMVGEPTPALIDELSMGGNPGITELLTPKGTDLRHEEKSEQEK